MISCFLFKNSMVVRVGVRVPTTRSGKHGQGQSCRFRPAKCKGSLAFRNEKHLSRFFAGARFSVRLVFYFSRVHSVLSFSPLTKIPTYYHDGLALVEVDAKHKKKGNHDN